MAARRFVRRVRCSRYSASFFLLERMSGPDRRERDRDAVTHGYRDARKL
jgi:hypothetical protein